MLQREACISAVDAGGLKSSLVCVDRDVIRTVTDAVDAYDIDLRAEAVDTLSSFEPSLVIDQLNRLAWGDSDEEVRENAVQGLGYLETQSANSLLLEIARNHPSSDTRSEAMQVLEDLVF